MGILPRVGNLIDESDSTFEYLAITSRGEDYPLQGMRVLVDCDSRQEAIDLGRTHFILFTLNEDGEHFGATLVEDYAYRVGENDLLQWETTEPKIIVESEGVTVIQTKRPDGG